LFGLFNSQNLELTPEARNFANLVRQQFQQQNVVNNRQERHLQENNDTTCPICLGGTRFTIETNCGHKFCGILKQQTIDLTILFL
jgi:hypothetical protein